MSTHKFPESTKGSKTPKPPPKPSTFSTLFAFLGPLFAAKEDTNEQSIHPLDAIWAEHMRLLHQYTILWSKHHQYQLSCRNVQYGQFVEFLAQKETKNQPDFDVVVDSMLFSEGQLKQYENQERGTPTSPSFRISNLAQAPLGVGNSGGSIGGNQSDGEVKNQNLGKTGSQLSQFLSQTLTHNALLSLFNSEKHFNAIEPDTKSNKNPQNNNFGKCVEIYDDKNATKTNRISTDLTNSLPTHPTPSPTHSIFSLSHPFQRPPPLTPIPQVLIYIPKYLDFFIFLHSNPIFQLLRHFLDQITTTIELLTNPSGYPFLLTNQFRSHFSPSKTQLFELTYEVDDLDDKPGIDPSTKDGLATANSKLVKNEGNSTQQPGTNLSSAQPGPANSTTVGNRDSNGTNLGKGGQNPNDKVGQINGMQSEKIKKKYSKNDILTILLSHSFPYHFSSPLHVSSDEITPHPENNDKNTKQTGKLQVPELLIGNLGHEKSPNIAQKSQNQYQFPFSKSFPQLDKKIFSSVYSPTEVLLDPFSLNYSPKHDVACEGGVKEPPSGNGGQNGNGSNEQSGQNSPKIIGHNIHNIENNERLLSEEILYNFISHLKQYIFSITIAIIITAHPDISEIKSLDSLFTPHESNLFSQHVYTGIGSPELNNFFAKVDWDFRLSSVENLKNLHSAQNLKHPTNLNHKNFPLPSPSRSIHSRPNTDGRRAPVHFKLPSLLTFPEEYAKKNGFLTESRRIFPKYFVIHSFSAIFTHVEQFIFSNLHPFIQSIYTSIHPFKHVCSNQAVNQTDNPNGESNSCLNPPVNSKKPSITSSTTSHSNSPQNSPISSTPESRNHSPSQSPLTPSPTPSTPPSLRNSIKSIDVSSLSPPITPSQLIYSAANEPHLTTNIDNCNCGCLNSQCICRIEISKEDLHNFEQNLPKQSIETPQTHSEPSQRIISHLNNITSQCQGSFHDSIAVKIKALLTVPSLFSQLSQGGSLNDHTMCRRITSLSWLWRFPELISLPNECDFSQIDFISPQIYDDFTMKQLQFQKTVEKAKQKNKPCDVNYDEFFPVISSLDDESFIPCITPSFYLLAAAGELLRMKQYYSKHSKLKCLLRCVKLLSLLQQFLTKVSGQNHFGADSFLPMFIAAVCITHDADVLDNILHWVSFVTPNKASHLSHLDADIAADMYLYKTKQHADLNHAKGINGHGEQKNQQGFNFLVKKINNFLKPTKAQDSTCPTCRFYNVQSELLGDIGDTSPSPLNSSMGQIGKNDVKTNPTSKPLPSSPRPHPRPTLCHPSLCFSYDLNLINDFSLEKGQIFDSNNSQSEQIGKSPTCHQRLVMATTPFVDLINDVYVFPHPLVDVEGLIVDGISKGAAIVAESIPKEVGVKGEEKSGGKKDESDFIDFCRFGFDTLPLKEVNKHFELELNKGIQILKADEDRIHGRKNFHHLSVSGKLKYKRILSNTYQSPSEDPSLYAQICSTLDTHSEYDEGLWQLYHSEYGYDVVCNDDGVFGKGKNKRVGVENGGKNLSFTVLLSSFYSSVLVHPHQLGLVKIFDNLNENEVNQVHNSGNQDGVGKTHVDLAFFLDSSSLDPINDGIEIDSEHHDGEVRYYITSFATALSSLLSISLTDIFAVQEDKFQQKLRKKRREQRLLEKSGQIQKKDENEKNETTVFLPQISLEIIALYTNLSDYQWWYNQKQFIHLFNNGYHDLRKILRIIQGLLFIGKEKINFSRIDPEEEQLVDEVMLKSVFGQGVYSQLVTNYDSKRIKTSTPMEVRANTVNSDKTTLDTIDSDNHRNPSFVLTNFAHPSKFCHSSGFSGTKFENYSKKYSKLSSILKSLQPVLPRFHLQRTQANTTSSPTTVTDTPFSPSKLPTKARSVDLLTNLETLITDLDMPDMPDMPDIDNTSDDHDILPLNLHPSNGQLLVNLDPLSDENDDEGLAVVELMDAIKSINGDGIVPDKIPKPAMNPSLPPGSLVTDPKAIQAWSASKFFSNIVNSVNFVAENVGGVVIDAVGHMKGKTPNTSVDVPVDEVRGEKSEEGHDSNASVRGSVSSVGSVGSNNDFEIIDQNQQLDAVINADQGSIENPDPSPIIYSSNTKSMTSSLLVPLSKSATLSNDGKEIALPIISSKFRDIDLEHQTVLKDAIPFNRIGLIDVVESLVTVRLQEADDPQGLQREIGKLAKKFEQLQEQSDLMKHKLAEKGVEKGQSQKGLIGNKVSEVGTGLTSDRLRIIELEMELAALKQKVSSEEASTATSTHNSAHQDQPHGSNVDQECMYGEILSCNNDSMVLFGSLIDLLKKTHKNYKQHDMTLVEILRLFELLKQGESKKL